MKVFTIFGFHHSGKTTTAEHVIAELRQRGHSVASIKDIQSEKFTMETEGSNTDLHKKAGSQLVTARGLYETDILFQERVPIEKLIGLYEYLGGFEFLLLEGENDFWGPGIVCGHNLEEVDRKWNKSQVKVFAVSGIVSAEIDGHRGLPAINALTDTPALVDLIEEKAEDWWQLQKKR